MAYLKFHNKTITECLPTVEVIISWLQREYCAEIKFIAPGEFYVFEIISDYLPVSKLLKVTIEELLPQILIVNVDYP